MEETHLIYMGFVNAYLVKAGDGYILIDTGIGPQWSRLEGELLQEGALPDHLKLVILTHGDGDHTGNCAELQRKYHAKIAMHAGDAGMARTGKGPERKAKTLTAKLMMKAGTLVGGNSATFEPDILLEDGQDLNEYGLAGRVIHLPGHTKGSIVILTDDGRLFIGDTLGNQGKPDTTPFIENDQELSSSIEKIKALQAHTVYPGHGKPFPFEVVAGISV